MVYWLIIGLLTAAAAILSYVAVNLTRKFELLEDRLSEQEELTPDLFQYVVDTDELLSKVRKRQLFEGDAEFEELNARLQWISIQIQQSRLFTRQLQELGGQPVPPPAGVPAFPAGRKLP